MVNSTGIGGNRIVGFEDSLATTETGDVADGDTEVTAIEADDGKAFVIKGIYAKVDATGGSGTHHLEIHPWDTFSSQLLGIVIESDGTADIDMRGNYLIDGSFERLNQDQFLELINGIVTDTIIFRYNNDSGEVQEGPRDFRLAVAEIEV